jgi:DNA-binding protein H-NS
MLYDELRAKAAEILAQAEQVKSEERQKTIDTVRVMIQTYDITARDLGLDKAVKAKTGPKPGQKVVPKYRDPASGATWSGRGKTPKWINGADRSQYAI